MIRGRFAPSPTGDLHLGNARTALLAWLQARSADGRFVMRVEDLDRARVRPGSMERQLDDLRWLGLDWDEGPDVGGPHAPYLQSERGDMYAEALELLRRKGLLFECVCSRREIAEAASAPHGSSDEGPRYPGTCALRPPRPESRRSRALRFRTPPGEVSFEDLVQGRMWFAPEEEVGAFVVRRKDGVAAYQLAVVVDDAAMQITDVLRAADLLPSTARQLQLYDALELRRPRWAHVPLLLGPDGERLSKRHGAVSLRELRRCGVDPAALVGWLASTCGLADPADRLAPRDLLGSFSLERITKKPTALSSTPWAPLRALAESA